MAVAKVPIRALSLPCPWPWYVAGVAGRPGRMRVVNAPYHPNRHRVPLPFYLALHAARRDEAGAAEYVQQQLWPDAPTDGPRSAIVCVALVTEAVPAEHLYQSLRGAEPGVAGWESGPWCWLLEDVVQLLDPVHCQPQRHLWELPPSTLAAVRRGYDQSQSELSEAPSYEGAQVQNPNEGRRST